MKQVSRNRRPQSAAARTYETVRRIRGTFGDISPVTKIIPNKKHDYIPDEYDYDSFEEYWHDQHHANYNEDYEEY